MLNLPLNSLLVLEFGQKMSAPLAALRLADMGARVIKIELVSNKEPVVPSAASYSEENFFNYQAINRNKESIIINTAIQRDADLLNKLLKEAQILLHNLPGKYMAAQGLSYDEVQLVNPGLVYGCISGYGSQASGKHLPDADALLQSLSGLAFTTGNSTDHPTPFGTPIADKLCSAQLVQGVIAAMIRRHKTGKGALVEVSLLESLLDFQFELLTTYYNCGQVPVRSNINNGHSLLSAPYGIYATANGFIAIAMVDLEKLGKAIDCLPLTHFSVKETFAKRDEIKTIISQHLKKMPSSYWLEKMHEQDLWTMEVLSWQQLIEHPAYKCLQMEQTLETEVFSFKTTRSPIRFGGKKVFSSKPAPFAGQHTESIANQFV